MAELEVENTPTYQHIDVEPLTANIGAVIHQVDLSQTLPEIVLREIHRALLQWKVIFLRDQAISTEDHLRFARWFGPLEIHPFAPEKPGYPEVLSIVHDEASPGRENIWHSDVTWRLQPSLGSVLRAIEVPDVGGDTLFSDMGAAYQGLDDTTKTELDGLTARHDFSGFRRNLRNNGASDDEIDAFNATYPNPHHPVVRTHPETGEKSLYVNRAFTQEIDGLDTQRSQALLEHLYAQAQKPEYQCRFRWQPNSIAFWDNRACQHYAVADYWPARRAVERVTICGDTPV